MILQHGEGNRQPDALTRLHHGVELPGQPYVQAMAALQRQRQPPVLPVQNTAGEDKMLLRIRSPGAEQNPGIHRPENQLAAAGCREYRRAKQRLSAQPGTAGNIHFHRQTIGHIRALKSRAVVGGADGCRCGQGAVHGRCHFIARMMILVPRNDVPMTARRFTRPPPLLQLPTVPPLKSALNSRMCE